MNWLLSFDLCHGGTYGHHSFVAWALCGVIGWNYNFSDKVSYTASKLSRRMVTVDFIVENYDYLHFWSLKAVPVARCVLYEDLPYISFILICFE